MRKKFEDCSRFANNNLSTRGNLSTFLVAYIDFANALGKENIALEEISMLPPSEAFEIPDKRVDMVVAACLDTKALINKQSMVR